ncbi:amidase, Asp-tRNAAsn/Glu-tRNAGln amidotransferase A subunit [Burkholderiales bacterium JOSHI_001]|nr:amidase, Asp-tRNAAsn/Glu-tRNAGln amidotransferase A subunit [Burkholderiales bacterium JOSHI_001]
MSELAFESASTLAARLRRREISSTELLRHFIARIEGLDGAINAVVVRDFDRALQRAQAADAALARGESWGPLHGLPMTVKESFDWAGTPTTWGIPAFKDNIATGTAVAVQRLLDAGAIVFGKTNVPVALADWQSFNPIYGTTNNPWNTERTPGGSSGGSAAALAAGFTALELGSDIGASIRNPAHYCGVWGHKPTWGVVPMQGHQLPGDECIDALDIAAAGPLARSAHDLTLAMDILTTPLSHFGPLGWTRAQWRDAGTPPTRLRVAIVADDPVAEVDASVRDEVRKLAAFLRERGFTVSETARPVNSEEAWEVYIHLLRSATGAHFNDADYAAALDNAKHHPPGSREFAAWHWHASTLSHREWVQYDERRAVLRRQWAAFFEQWDVLICPVATAPAFRHMQTGFRWERMLQVNGHDQPTTQQLFWAGYPGLCGLPATAVPLGHSADGLPIGAQIVGPVFGDPTCLRLARWLEAEYRGFVAPPGLA